MVVTLQLTSGAYRTERGNYSDEASHFLNAVLLRDYVYDGLSRRPIDFAREYYANYPKVAPLMWPPLFHTTLGLWLLPGWPPDAAAIALIGVIAALAAARLFGMMTPVVGRAGALVAAGAFLIAPVTTASLRTVMLDIGLAALAVEATWRLQRYFDLGRTRDAAIFGLVTAAACLTKGNGVAFVLVPVLMMVATRRYDVLRARGLYVAAAIVLVVALPLLLASYRNDVALGNPQVVPLKLAIERTSVYAQFTLQNLGVLPAILAVVGVAVAFRRGHHEDWRTSRMVAFASMFAAVLIFHVFNPHYTMADERYFLIMLAPLAALLVWGVDVIAEVAVQPRSRRLLRGVLLGAVSVSVVVAAWRSFTPGTPLGYRAIVAHLEAQKKLAGSRILVVSEERGEGAFVAAAAVRRAAAPATIVRGSKFLASDDWMGRNLTLRFTSVAEIASALDDARIDFVVIDESPEARLVRYWGAVRALIASRSGSFELLFRTEGDRPSGPSRHLKLYGYRKRLLTASQLTTFHQAAR